MKEMELGFNSESIVDENEYHEETIYKQEVVMERSSIYDDELTKIADKLDSAANAAICIKKLMRPERLVVEQFGILLLDTKLKLVGYSIVFTGGISSSLVEPIPVFQRAILANCQNIILFHNHLTGDLTPSKEDLMLTKRLSEGGKILGISVQDHFIVNHKEKPRVCVRIILAIFKSERRINMDKVKELMEQLEGNLEELFESEKYTRWLTTLGKFHRYSFYNTILIASQRPDASWM